MIKKNILLGLIIAFSSQSYATTINSETFKNLDYKSAVTTAHTLYKNNEGIMIKVLPNRIVATFSDGKSSFVAIPKDQFFLSIAPYINSSHPCTNHVLTGCTGEIKNQVMKVVMIDTDTGETLIDKKVTTQRDGFIDFWVPKDKNLAFNIYHKAKDGSERVAREVLSTFNNDRTCITTMQLIES